MLKRVVLIGLATAFLLAVVVPGEAADAGCVPEGSTSCTEGNTKLKVCRPVVGTCQKPGVDVKPVPGSAAAVCTWGPTGAAIVVPCSDPRGYWSQDRQCYVAVVSPQPPGDDFNWDGHYPDGAIYSCIVGDALSVKLG